MPEQFKSMNELLGYLGDLEERIKTLEMENGKLLAITSRQENVDEAIIENVVLDYLPDSNLIDHNFFKRAFAVWGHFFVANLIIGVVVRIAYACLAMVLFGSILGNLSQSL